MKASSSNSKAMVPKRNKAKCTHRVMDESLTQAEEFKYFGALFMSDGKLEQGMDRWIGALSEVMRGLLRSHVVKRELEGEAFNLLLHLCSNRHQWS